MLQPLQLYLEIALHQLHSLLKGLEVSKSWRCVESLFDLTNVSLTRPNPFVDRLLEVPHFVLKVLLGRRFRSLRVLESRHYMRPTSRRNEVAVAEHDVVFGGGE